MALLCVQLISAQEYFESLPENPAVVREIPIQKLAANEKTTAKEIKGKYRLITK